MRGADLKCDCGQGARDIAPDYELEPMTSYEWTCLAGHLHISGWRELTGRWEQMRFDNPKKEPTP